MKRFTKLVILASFALFGCAYFVAGSSYHGIVVSANSGPADIYAAHCAKCHGADGRARTAKGKRVGATDFTSEWNRDEARGMRIITNGKDEMPSFKKKLSAAEIKAVFTYVSRFR